ncbi:MAG: hypothetical protein ABSE82_13065 [Nitrososphaerales archaeon]|jgi:hypothetical protein
MSDVYVVRDGKTEPMEVVLCKNEDRELQTILKNNFNLLPGDQIDPDVPPRWMLIKREMPVPDPLKGTGRWSIDFFLVDQNATPTFVECKRYLDARARREVVGQILEYAANAQYYWNADDIRTHAESTAQENQTTVDELFGRLHSDLAESTEEFFREVEKKLKSGDIRIVFFLEQAPPELKRLVEFMNNQMGTIEVLLVEARQYQANGVRVVVPTLFGFTEKIRQVKIAVSTEKSRQPVAVDWESFERNAELRGLDKPTVDAMRRVYETCKSLRADISWGRGTLIGSFSPKWSFLHTSTSPFSICSNGRLDTHLGAFQNTEVAKGFSETFTAQLKQGGFELPQKYHGEWLSIETKKWVPHVDTFIAALRDALEKKTSQPQLG